MQTAAHHILLTTPICCYDAVFIHLFTFNLKFLLASGEQEYRRTSYMPMPKRGLWHKPTAPLAKSRQSCIAWCR